MSKNYTQDARAMRRNAGSVVYDSLLGKVKIIALRMGVSVKTVYAWIEGRRKLDVRDLPLVVVIAEAYDIVHALCADCGGLFVLKRQPNVEAARTVDLARVMREFADAAEHATRALADGHISHAEYEAFQREMTEARQAMADYEWHFGELYRAGQGQLEFTTLAEAEGAV